MRVSHPACSSAVAIAALVAITVAATHATQHDAVTVRLIEYTDTRTDSLWGMSNIMFAPAGLVHVPGIAQAVPAETALVARGGIQSVAAVRWHGADTAWTYAVDTDGDRDFSREQPLGFRRVGISNGAIWLADFVVRARSVDTVLAAARPVPLQLAHAGQFTYARPMRTLLGSWVTNGVTRTIRVRPRSRDAALSEDPASLDIAIDLDGDGMFRTSRDTARHTVHDPNEGVGTAPFMAAGSAWRVNAASISDGHLRIESVSPAERAVAEGFRAPPLRVSERSTGRLVDLAQAAGDSVTVIEFWSIHCPFSEMVRPHMNTLVAEFAGRPIRWYSVPRERELAVLDSVLKERPRAQRVPIAELSEWLAYNPLTITPLYVVLDADGRVLLREVGAGGSALIRGAIGAALQRASPTQGEATGTP